jgi:hypothetical protein
VISYNTNRVAGAGKVVSPKAEHWWQQGWVRNLPTFLALAVITISVLYCLGLSTNPKVVVSTTSPQAVVLRDKAEYQRGAQRILEDSALSRTKFTVNTGGFERAFRAAFPEVDDVSLALPLVSRTPIVTISTAQPQLLLTAQGKVYVLDKRGTAIMMANDLSSSIRQTLPVVDDQSGLSVSVGKTVLPAEQIQYITSVLAQFKAKQVAVETITLPATAQEVDIKPAGKPYYVKFSTSTEAREAAGDYLATKQRLEQTNTTPTQYVDVRVPGRAYYP